MNPQTGKQCNLKRVQHDISAIWKSTTWQEYLKTESSST